MDALPLLVTVSAQGFGRKYRLGDECVLGRFVECDVQLVDSQISKRHARIYRGGDGHLIEDLGSRNGVVVNGERLTAPRLLAPDDAIALGGYLFLFSPTIEVIPDDAGDQALVLTPEPHDPATIAGTSAAARADRSLAGAAGANDAGSGAASALARLLGAVQRGLAADRLWPAVSDLLHVRFGFDAAAVLGFAGGDSAAVEPLHIAGERRTLSVPRAIVAACAERRRGVAIGDALGDTSFAQSRSIVQGQVRSVLAVPLCLGDACLGLAYLTKDRANAYSEEDLAALTELAPGLALAVQVERRLAEMQRQVSHGRARGAVEAPAILGQSAAIEAVRAFVRKAAKAPSPVLIFGPTGSGKEPVARQLHAEGRGSEAPFIAVNCGAIPDTLVESEFFGYERGAFSGALQRKPGKLELAQGGTLFLDEIAELPLDLQVKLLRALEEQSFYRLGGVKPVQADFRLVAATHRDLKAMVEAGTFRQDLFFRIHVLAVRNPALGERPDDVGIIARHFLARFRAELGSSVADLEPAALAALERYAWPGNVRELRNVLERVAVFSEASEVALGDLPPEIAAASGGGATAAASAGEPPGSLAVRVAELERQAIGEAMAQARGKKAAAAKLLGISRPTLDKKLALYGIAPGEGPA